MIGLFAQCMFEATRISPLDSFATEEDKRFSAGRFAKTERVKISKRLPVNADEQSPNQT